jgi:hypothetical protein
VRHQILNLACLPIPPRPLLATARAKGRDERGRPYSMFQDGFNSVATGRSGI